MPLGQASTQEGTGQGRGLDQQGVPSEELTSREGEAESGKSPSNSGLGAEAADASSMHSWGKDAKGAEGRSGGQSMDEAEDTTTRMLQSAGTLVIPVLTSQLVGTTLNGGPTSLQPTSQCCVKANCLPIPSPQEKPAHCKTNMLHSFSRQLMQMSGARMPYVCYGYHCLCA